MMALRMAIAAAGRTAAGGTIVDDFAIAGTDQKYSFSANNGTGTWAVSGGELVLTPQTALTNSVSARRTGNYRSATVRAKIAPNGSGRTEYFGLTLGRGAIVALVGANWWNTTLADGYFVHLQTDQGVYVLWKMVNGTNAAKLATTTAYPSDYASAYHDYGLSVRNGRVQCLIDGAPLIDVADTAFGAGDLLIYGGANTDSNGCAPHIPTVTVAA